jgi:hypothetical protein
MVGENAKVLEFVYFTIALKEKKAPHEHGRIKTAKRSPKLSPFPIIYLDLIQFRTIEYSSFDQTYMILKHTVLFCNHNRKEGLEAHPIRVLYGHGSGYGSTVSNPGTSRGTWGV